MSPRRKSHVTCHVESQKGMVFLRIFRHSPVRSFSCGRGYATNPPASIAKAISAEASKKPASPSSERAYIHHFT